MSLYAVDGLFCPFELKIEPRGPAGTLTPGRSQPSICKFPDGVEFLIDARLLATSLTGHTAAAVIRVVVKRG
jgi:hypothetical protein